MTEVVRYLTRKVDAALRPLTAAQASPRALLQADLARARAELDNVKQAILQGILTSTTREMLETCERRVADLEAQLRTPSSGLPRWRSPPLSKVISAISARRSGPTWRTRGRSSRNFSAK